MSLPASRIVSLACQIAKCPGFTNQGGEFLNLVLNDLCLHRDLKINRVTQYLTVQANSNGPFTLESNYLRPYDLFFLQNGLPYFLNLVSTAVYDSEFKDPSISNYPYEYATDLSVSPGLLYIYPQSSGQITLTHRYMVNHDDLASPATSSDVPWFPDQDYLIKATATRLMQLTDDERYESYVAGCEKMLLIHLIMEGDEMSVVKEVALDPRRFKLRRSLKPTKLTD